MTETSGKPHVILGLLTFGPDPPARVTTLPEFNTVLDIYQSRGYSEVTQHAPTTPANKKASPAPPAINLELFPDPTKTNPQEHVSDIRSQFETSLKELGTDSVDILYLHAPSRDVSFFLTLSAIASFHAEGKFRHFGLSNFAAFEVAEIVMICEKEGWVKPSVYQGTYNALARSVEDELLPCLRRYNISFYAYSPLAGGLLTDRYMENNVTGWEGLMEGRFSEASGKLGKGYREMWYRESNLEALKPVFEVARREGVSMLQVALRWMVWHSPLDIANNGDDGVVIGASNKEQLDENLDALEQGPLPDEVLDRLEEAWKMVKGEADPYWAGKLEYGTDAQEVLVSKP